MDLKGELKKQGIWGIIEMTFAIVGASSFFSWLWGYISRDLLLSIIIGCFLVLLFINFRYRLRIAETNTILDSVRAILVENDTSIQKVYSDTHAEIEKIKTETDNRISYYKCETINYQDECKKLFDLNIELSRQLGEHTKIGGHYVMGGNLVPSTPEDEIKVKIHDHIRQKIE